LRYAVRALIKARSGQAVTISPDRKVKVIQITPQTWIGRLIATVIGISMLIVLLFFFSMVFALFLSIAIVSIGWAIWTKSRNTHYKQGNTIEGEYTVDESRSDRQNKIIKSRKDR
jgi:membrane protein implicated in regulation of membrane protease activity